mgnify:CR=1 FL=1
MMYIIYKISIVVLVVIALYLLERRLNMGIKKDRKRIALSQSHERSYLKRICKEQLKHFDYVD